MTNPYHDRPERSFWKPAVAERHVADLADLWDPIPMTRQDRIATAGSCFAQHIGRNLRHRGASFMDLEPAPPIFPDAARAQRFGYGVFSCRYGNIYTARQMLQLAQEALDERRPEGLVWERDGRFFDSLRPGVDPVGQASAEDVIISRKAHLRRVREMLESLDVLVFTMGLTEGWESLSDGTMFPTAPGTIAGNHDATRFAFRNLRYGEIVDDMARFWALLKSVNASARMLLTVSPVPLIATASDSHVLPATTYSKSVLRAVAGDLAADHRDIHYFPSYELIVGHPSRGFFFEPDLRNVNQAGVNLVMTHFFSGALAQTFGATDSTGAEPFDPVCDEAKIVPEAADGSSPQS